MRKKKKTSYRFQFLWAVCFLFPLTAFIDTDISFFSFLFHWFPLAGIAGCVFWFKKKPPPRRYAHRKKKSPKKRYKYGLFLFFFLMQIGLVFQSRWETGIWELLIMAALAGYVKIILLYPFDLALEKPRYSFRQQKPSKEDIFCLISTFFLGVHLWYFFFYIWNREEWYYMGKLTIQLSHFSFIIQPQDFLFLLLLSLPWAFFMFAQENRQKNNVFHFLVNGASIFLQLGNSLVFLPLLWCLLISISGIFTLLKIPGGRREKQNDRNTLVLYVGITLISFVLWTIGDSYLRNQWLGHPLEKWQRMKIKIQKHSLLEHGKETNFQLQISNLGSYDWSADHYGIVLQLVDSGGTYRLGKQYKISFEREIRAGEKWETHVSLPIPYWYQKGGILAKLYTEELGTLGKHEVNAFARLPEIDQTEEIKNNLPLHLLIAREDRNHRSRKSSDREFQEEISNPLDRLIRRPWLGTYVNYETKLIKGNAYGKLYANFGLILGSILVFLAIWLLLNFYWNLVFQKNSMELYFWWYAVKLALLSGFWCDFPLTITGRIYLLFTITQIWMINKTFYVGANHLYREY